MTTLREEILYRSPKILSNLALALIFWGARYILLVTLNPVNAEHVFLVQTGLLIVTGIFLVRTLFNALTVADKLTGFFLKCLGIKEDWSRQRILKDTIYIVALLLAAAALFPLFNILSNFEPILGQITTYFTLGMIFLFVFDIGRTVYRITEKKADSIVNRISNSRKEEKKINGK